MPRSLCRRFDSGAGNRARWLSADTRHLGRKQNRELVMSKQEPCGECGTLAVLRGKRHCLKCFKRFTIPCPAGCKRRVYEIRTICEPCQGKGLVECNRCYKWRKPYMLDHCRECVKVVKFECAHMHGVRYKSKCISCFVEQAHTITSYDKNNAVGDCRFCGKVSVSLKPSGATCQPWNNFLTRARNYSLSPEQLEQLYLEQQGACAICGGPESSTMAFSIDHDHGCCNTSRSCGKCVRGLLCKQCNSALGMVDDSVFVLEMAIRYLKDPKWRALIDNLDEFEAKRGTE